MKLIARSILILLSFTLSTFSVSAQLMANFTADVTSGCSPLTVHFHSTTTPTLGTTYDWVGVGTGVLHSPDVVGTYTTPGTYTIWLTAHNGGFTDAHSITITVLACGPCTGIPFAGYASATSNCGGEYILQLSGYTLATGLSFQWQDSPNGITWTNIPGATDVSHTFTPSETDFYQCKVTCSLSGLYSFSSVVNIPVIAGVHLFYTTLCSPDTSCTGLHLYVAACTPSSSYSVVTQYGDGTIDTVSLTSTGPYYADIFHNYSTPGTFTIRQYLYDGLVLLDSLEVHYEYLFCHTLPVKFYYDANNTCVFDTGDAHLTQPVKTVIDSNGITIDTVSTTSGFYYYAYGPPGTVYSFRILSTLGVGATCPPTGILYDTIQAGVNYYPIKYCGMNCSVPGFDLAEFATMICGKQTALGAITINNTYCMPEAATITMTFSPKYHFGGAVPTPTSVIGNIVTWNVGPVDQTAPLVVKYSLNVPGPWLIIGDTINTVYEVSPTIGDMDPTNNIVIRNDTVKSSYDPNYVEVTPDGYISSGIQLTYTIHFENTGNDTAHNIYVLDTLSDYLLPGSLSMLMASSEMNLYKFTAGGHNIIKFDFPKINLLDSSHHNECDGMFRYTINTMPGLPDGTLILNHAGIYFDDNDVVNTDTAINVIGIPTLSQAELKNNHKVDIYPNPATDEFIIKTNNESYSSYTVSNSLGQILIQQQISAPQTKVNVQKLTPGLYYVTLRGAGGSVVQKVVKL